jgi:hypothetical protein
MVNARGHIAKQPSSRMNDKPTIFDLFGPPPSRSRDRLLLCACPVAPRSRRVYIYEPRGLSASARTT